MSAKFSLIIVMGAFSSGCIGSTPKATCPVSPRPNIDDPVEKTIDAAAMANAATIELRPSSDKKATRRAEQCVKGALKVLPKGEDTPELRADERARLKIIRNQLEFILWVARNWNIRNPQNPKRRKILDDKWKEIEQFPDQLDSISVRDRDDQIRVFDVLYQAMITVDHLDQDNEAQFNTFADLARDVLSDSPFFSYPNLSMLLDAHVKAIQKGIHKRDRQGAYDECSRLLNYPFNHKHRRPSIRSALSTCESILEGDPSLLDRWNKARSASSWKTIETNDKASAENASQK